MAPRRLGQLLMGSSEQARGGRSEAVNDQTMQPYRVSFFANRLSMHRPLVDGLVADLGAAPLSSMDTDRLLV